MAQIEGLQVNITAKIDQLQKSLDDAKKGLASVATESERQAQRISNPLKGAADAIEARYGTLAGTLTTRLIGLVNPATIAATAITAVGAGLLAYYESLQDKVIDVDAALQTHSKLIKEIKSAYGEAMAGLEQYTKESENSFRTRIAGSLFELQQGLQQTARTFTDQFGPTIYRVMRDAETGVMSFGDSFFRLPAKFEPFRSAIETLQASIRAGNPDFVTFKNSVDAIGASAVGVNPELAKTAAELANGARNAYSMQQGIAANTAALQNMTPEARSAAAALSNFNAALKAMESIAPAKKTDRYKADEEFLRATLGVTDPNMIRQAVQARNDTYARIEAEEAAKFKPASVKADNSAEQLAREQESITKRLEMLTVGWGTEEEKLAAHLIKNQDLINLARQKEAIDDETHKILMLGAEEEYQKKMENLRMAGMNSALTATGEVFSAMGRVVQAGSKKNVRLAKMFGIAEAIIATMVAANKAMAVSASAGPAAAFAAWAAVAAKGLATVAAIRSVSESGGGGSAAGAASGGGGGGGAAAADAGGAAGRGPGGNSVYINLQGQSFGRDQVRDLVKQIADFQKDGGQVVFA